MTWFPKEHMAAVKRQARMACSVSFKDEVTLWNTCGAVFPTWLFIWRCLLNSIINISSWNVTKSQFILDLSQKAEKWWKSIFIWEALLSKNYPAFLTLALLTLWNAYLSAGHFRDVADYTVMTQMREECFYKDGWVLVLYQCFSMVSWNFSHVECKWSIPALCTLIWPCVISLALQTSRGVHHKTNIKR